MPKKLPGSNEKPLNSLALLMIAAALLVTAVGCRGTGANLIASRSGQHLDFNQDVQPVLASNCFSCHGPDPEMRKAGLRLDLEESAFQKRPGNRMRLSRVIRSRANSSNALNRATLII